MGTALLPLCLPLATIGFLPLTQVLAHKHNGKHCILGKQDKRNNKTKIWSLYTPIKYASV